MKKIALINFYFADTIPDYMDFYLSSVTYNDSIDLYLFTNLKIKSSAKNIKIVYLSFEEFSQKIISSVKKEMEKREIYDEVRIESPYKIADFRPAFGVCFQDYLKEYDFWGGCDLDLIFGDIRKFLPEDVLDNYDKIYEHGHFFLIRNTYECNTAFLEDYENCFKAVLHLKKNSFFEEVYEKPWIPHGGINAIFKRKGKLYTNRKAFCDISFKYTNLIDIKNPSSSNQNIFEFNQGKLYRYSLNKKEIDREEVFYAHFQKRRLKVKTSDLKHFLIGNDAFYQYNTIKNEVFKITDKYNIVTIKYIRFKYFDAISRKLNGDFKWR